MDKKAFLSDRTASMYINLHENAAGEDYAFISKPVLINSVTATLKEINAPRNVIRFNGWPTFLQRKVWEVAGEITEELSFLLTSINKEIIAVPDTPGFISPRIISMIINEAYYALEDEVSSRYDIDTAMKLGTNYPYGPFEWAEKIGLMPIAGLLQKLSGEDKRYLPASLLLKEALA